MQRNSPSGRKRCLPEPAHAPRGSLERGLAGRGGVGL